jgi:hypothetical protein
MRADKDEVSDLTFMTHYAFAAITITITILITTTTTAASCCVADARAGMHPCFFEHQHSAVL